MLGKYSTPVVSPKIKSGLVSAPRGLGQVDIRPMIDSGWIDHITKLGKQSDLKESADWKEIALTLPRK